MQDLSEPLIWDTRPAGPLKGQEHFLVVLSTSTCLYLNAGLLVKMTRRSLEEKPNGHQAWRGDRPYLLNPENPSSQAVVALRPKHRFFSSNHRPEVKLWHKNDVFDENLGVLGSNSSP